MKVSKEAMVEFCKKNAKLLAGGGIVLILAVILIISSLSGKKDPDDKEEVAKKEEEQDVEDNNDLLLSNDLEEDAYPEINELMKNYLAYVADGNIEQIETLVDTLPDDKKKQIQDKQEYTEGYENIKCYTKRGPEADTYIVFVTYEEKFVDIDTLLPSLQAFYIAAEETSANSADDKKTDDKKADDDQDKDAADGDENKDSDPDKKEDSKEIVSYYIVNGEVDENTIAFIAGINEDQDVVDLCAAVDEAYKAALESDENLNKFVVKLLKAAGLDEEEPEPQEEQPADEEPEAPADETPEEPQQDEPTTLSDEERTRNNRGEPGRLVVLSNNVDVLAKYEDGADLIYSAAAGETLQVEMDYAEGWSKVTVYHNGKVGYVKTMYLE